MKCPIWGRFWGNKCYLGEWQKEGAAMRKRGFKGRCEKRMLSKSKEVCRLYDPIQSAYANQLEKDDAIREIRCNVPLDDGEHMTDFSSNKCSYPLLNFTISSWIHASFAAAYISSMVTD